MLALMESLGQQFVAAPPPEAPTAGLDGSPEAQLRGYFASLVQQLHHTPERFVVVSEFFLQAQRDLAVQQIVQEDIAWQHYLTSILEAGIAQGQFRADLDTSSAALAIIAFCKGIPLLANQSPDAVAAVVAQFEASFFALACAVETRYSRGPGSGARGQE